MNDLIRRALSCVGLLFGPGTGRRRSSRVVPPAGVPAAAPPPAPVRRRRPADPPPIDGDRSPLVRPYLVAHERVREQRERRVALALALAGLDSGPVRIHGVPVGVA